MANNIPGIARRIQPRVAVRERTQSRSVAGNAGDRLLCIIGEGEAEEVLVASALGGGQDGFNSDFSGTSSPEGRYFKTSKTELIANRTTLLKNGVPLTILEASIDTNPFDSRYDARLEISTGRIQLQQAYLVNVGGTTASPQFWSSPNDNTGNGHPVLSATSLIDTSAPAETWTARVISVIRDGYGNRIPGKATISVSGSVSGVIKDVNGNPVRWLSDGTTVSNGILSFAFIEGFNAFDVGDRFTIRVDSGVLSKGDELVARYIATQDLNDPEIFDGGLALYAKHGQPDTSHPLSLAAQLAFENGAPRVMALQAKPPVPRRTSAVLMAADNPLTSTVEGASGGFANKDTIFPLPLGALPDVDTDIHIFVVNSDGTENQLQLSKNTFYNSAWSNLNNAYSGFVTGPFSQAYTVILAPQVEEEGNDGYVKALDTTHIRFNSPTASFVVNRLAAGEDDTTKQLVITTPAGIAATFTIDTIGDGYGDNSVVFAHRTSGTHTAGATFSNCHWQLIDPADTGAQLAITDDIALNNLTVGKGLRISYVDTKDADFFDETWTEALEQLETVDCQIIVPVPTATISNIFQAARIHCETMSATVNGRERNLIIGAIEGLTPDNLIGRTQAAVEDIGILEGIQGDDPEEVLADNIEDLANYSVDSAYGNTYRVTYMAPDRIIRNINGTNTIIAGYYLAACLGGFLAGNSDLAEPPTMKRLTGFSIERSRTYRSITLDELASAHVCVVQPVAGGGQILHGLTTSNSGAPEEEEISIIYIRDAAAKALRNALSPFLGTKSGPTTLPKITSAAKNTLDALVGQGLLTTYVNLSVAKDSIEPRQYNVSATIAPTTPVDWIFVDLTVTV